MLTGKCINPEIMEALSLCGHGSKILIADGNYPLKNRTTNAKRIYLGLTPGMPTVTDVLEALCTSVNFEAAAVMQPEDGTEPEVFVSFRQYLPDVSFIRMERYEFYDACCEPQVELAISTGEKRTYANLLLTVGCA